MTCPTCRGPMRTDARLPLFDCERCGTLYLPRANKIISLANINVQLFAENIQRFGKEGQIKKGA